MAPKDANNGQHASKKRKGGPGSSSDNNNNNASRMKRVKTQRDARTLAVQTTSKAFKNGQLDVGSFVKAREYEIRAIQEGLERSKKALTQRAFQQVPKELRRRTASHNAKRVPKRLRKQAVREMADDNTPTVTSRRRKPTRHMRLRMETIKKLREIGARRDVAAKKGLGTGAAKQESGVQGVAVTTRAAKVKKNVLSSEPPVPAKYRKRQLHKTWLPTHIYHAKRAHMTPPQEPLWRFSIPLTSTAKSYRPTHRASTEKGAIAWDTSYMSCINIEGIEESVQGVLKALGVGSPDDTTTPWGQKGQRWRNGTRIWQGWLHERDSHPTKPIAPATVIWRAEPHTQAEYTNGKPNEHNASRSRKPRRQALVRIHPSGFLQLWEQVTRLVKVQKPQAVAEDLRFEIGSIEITGPASTEALRSALRPVKATNTGDDSNKTEDTWAALGGVTNPAVLPAHVLLAFDISDPRLHHPPRTIQAPDPDQNNLLKILSQWPCDSSDRIPGLFDRSRRMAASRALSSQKAINRRKTSAAPGYYPVPLPQDPRIPVLVYPSLDSSSGKRKQTKWTILLPWKAVPPVWQSIMYYPLSTGGQVRLGGLQEQRQISFESGCPWFPADYPGTEAGKAWEALESARRRKEWERRPKGKRVEWDSLALGSGQTGEIGDGSACDWTYLTRTEERSFDGTTTAETRDDSMKNTSFQLPSNIARALLTGSPSKPLTSSTLADADRGLMTVRLTLLTRGVATPCARIYSIPKEASIRSQWLALDPTTGSRLSRSYKRELPPSLGGGLRGLPQSIIQQKLAADLVCDPASLVEGDKQQQHPPIPDKEDLIGFVTTGEFCLTEGKGTAIGSLLASKALSTERAAEGTILKSHARRLCIVRNAGETVGRLAEWEVV
ncbi:hypothetical protein AAFC00_003196 [Neodothiora populina]|uniref:POPLD-domain-containing protein n=1 Tax=Neodothiora populina TaxID=2781224 RepID=A0ABR3P9M3_9PEZI